MKERKKTLNFHIKYKSRNLITHRSEQVPPQCYTRDKRSCNKLNCVPPICCMILPHLDSHRNMKEINSLNFQFLYLRTKREAKRFIFNAATSVLWKEEAEKSAKMNALICACNFRLEIVRLLERKKILFHFTHFSILTGC